jgi:hypothetical protein
MHEREVHMKLQDDLKERDHWEDLGIDGRISKWLLKK